MTPVVEFRDVTKRYRLGRERLNLRQAVPGRWGQQLRGDVHDALLDFGLQVPPGESVGIVGPNGAGKTTLLKLAAHVIGPSTGEVVVRGRTAALIELGAGFHPDMTGRENVHFSAAVLGMGRRATKAKFDRIVEFAGIGEYLDTPVKRYSSGMHARLGFAVASHLDADLLLVDEVLSVGDAAFQRRCHERIRELKNEGCAILFVTHNTWVVPLVCDRAILLSDGRAVADGDPVAVLARYDSQGSSMRTTASGLGVARIREVTVVPPVIDSGEPATVEIDLEVLEPSAQGHLLLGVSRDGRTVDAGLSSYGSDIDLRTTGRTRLRCSLDAVPLQAGEYSIYVSVLSDIGQPVIEDQHQARLEIRGDPRDRSLYGAVALTAYWSQLRLDDA